jgi:hypothetical protein
VVNYGELADRAQALQQAEIPSAAESLKKSDSDARLFFERVKEHIVEEMSKANAELAKRRVEGIERVFSPGFHGKLCMTFGSSLFCSVDLQTHAEGGRITAVINGPPNGYEISRKEFLFSCPPQEKAAPLQKGARETAGAAPGEIAIEIVSGLIQGRFN